MTQHSPTQHAYFPLLRPPSWMNPNLQTGHTFATLSYGEVSWGTNKQTPNEKNVGISSIHGGGLVGAGSLRLTHFANEKNCVCLIHPWWWVGGCWFPVADTIHHGHDAGPECQRCNGIQYKE